MKAIYNKIIVSAMVGAAGLTIAGCTDLDETIYSRMASEKYEFTDADLEATIAPVYSSLRDVYWGWFGMADIMDESSDVWGIPNRIGIGWGDLYISLHKHEFNSGIGHFSVNWGNNYAGVNACNQILANEQVSGSELIKAQVRAYRAMYYYNLFDLFRNIPLDTTFVHPDGWTPEQAAPEVTYQWIERELKDVAEHCGEDVSLGKLSKYAAYMQLAKLYLNHDAWFPEA